MVKIEHAETGGPPTRLEVRKELATILKTDLELVYVKKIETKTGTMTAFGEANAYDSVEQAKLTEPKYTVARNLPPKPPEEAQTPEKQEKTEKPMEKPEKQEKAEKPKLQEEKKEK